MYFLFSFIFILVILLHVKLNEKVVLENQLKYKVNKNVKSQ